MRSCIGLPLLAAVLLLVAPPGLLAQATTVTCTSKLGERQICPADTSAGVAVTRSTGEAECLLGKTWGYDEAGVWVRDGCAGEFVLGVPTRAAAVPAPGGGGTPAAAPPSNGAPGPPIETWGEFAPGEGFLVGRGKAGELSLSGYALVRWIDQTPTGQTFTDHLGNERPVDARNDISAHRVMIFFKGWLGTSKLVYNIFLWTVNTTDQKGILPIIGYQFGRKFSLYAGLNGLPGTRSIQGSHPFWLAPDRVMCDEYFGPYFTNAVWASGEVLPGLWYNAALGNNTSSLGIKATDLDRTYAYGASLWWEPTTHEFGPPGGYGDWERHEKVATRFGFGYVKSPETRQVASTSSPSNNTTIRLADSLNVFDTGSLAPDVTVQKVDYEVHSVDAGVKYRGFFLHAELYNPWLDRFEADGPLPVAQIRDVGFHVQASLLPVPKKLDMPFPKPGQDPYPARQLAEVLKRHPKATVIWAHCGLGRIVHPVKDQIGIVARALANPELAHVSFDISWDETAKYLVATPESTQFATDLINAHPDRFLFGTDEVAPTDQAKYLKVYDLYAPLFAKLTPAARERLLKGNYERLFDEARHRVRAWEKANPS